MSKKPICVKDLNELLKLKKDGFEIYQNKNYLSSLNENTEIIVVGTFIPQNIDYFYFGDKGRKLYQNVIDASRETNFDEEKEAIKRETNANKKQQLLIKFIDHLAKEKIAFCDLFKDTLQKVGEVTDGTIVAYTIDNDFISKINNHKSSILVVPGSRLAEEILRTNVTNKKAQIKYCQMFNGGKNDDWIEIFSINKNIQK